MTDPQPTPDAPPADGGPKPDQSFTQADVDRIVSERIQRERTKFADYDDLKAKAEGAKTLEDRIAGLETKGALSEQRALRAEIAGEFGISTKRGDNDEPSDADLFLTGTDVDTLRKQGERFASRGADLQKQNNHVPREGIIPPVPADKKRDFVRSLTDRD